MKKLAFFLIATVFAGLSAAGVKNVAVVETEVDKESGASAKLTKAEVRLVTGALRGEAVKYLPRGRYNVMTSETVYSQMGSEKLAECADENCVILLGSKIGADYIVRGTISKIGAKLTLSIELYETEDGNLVDQSPLVRTENAEKLIESAALASAEMFKSFVGAQNAGAQNPAPKPIPPAAYAVGASSAGVSVSAPTYQQSGGGEFGAFTDSRDSKKYKTVAIGGKTWMAQNLNYKTGNSWCYGNNNTNCDKYGRLYNWITAMNACPSGWHPATRQEWDILVTAVGGYSMAGTRLKSTSGWNSGGNGTDNYGFSALPGGNRYYRDGSFNGTGYFGSFWTATERGNNFAYIRHLGNDYNVNENYSDKGFGMSLRCVGD
jgi:uncharacterized protein (TIGR02145 family)